MNVVLCKHSVATAPGKRGIWKSTFQDGENREFAKNIKKYGIHHQHRENLELGKNNELVN